MKNWCIEKLVLNTNARIGVQRYHPKKRDKLSVVKGKEPHISPNFLPVLMWCALLPSEKCSFLFCFTKTTLTISDFAKVCVCVSVCFPWLIWTALTFDATLHTFSLLPFFISFALLNKKPKKGKKQKKEF